MKTNANENIRSHYIEILLSSGSPHVTVASRGYEEQDPFLLPPAIYYCVSESDQLRVPAWKRKQWTKSVLKGGLEM